MTMSAIMAVTTYSTLPVPEGNFPPAFLPLTENPTAAPAEEKTSPKLFTPSEMTAMLLV